MNRDELIQKILGLVETSPLKEMFTAMPWWGHWEQMSEPGLLKVLETIEWHRSRVEDMVEEAIAKDPDAHNVAYGLVRHADIVKMHKDEAQDNDGDWSTDTLLAQI